MTKDLHDPHTSVEQQADLWEKVQKVRFAMVTTRDAAGALASRPMTLQGVDDDGTLWFFTSANTQLGDDVRRDAQVNVAFADTGDSFYLSAAGKAFFVDDREKVEALWNPIVRAWFDCEGGAHAIATRQGGRRARFVSAGKRVTAFNADRWHVFR